MQSEILARTLAKTKNLGGDFHSLSAIISRALVDKHNAVQIDPDDLATALTNLLATSGASTKLSTLITGTDLTTSGVLTTLATNLGAHDTQAQTLVTALLAVTNIKAGLQTLLTNTPVWTKYSIPVATFQAIGASTSGTVAIFTLPIAGVIHAVKVKPTTIFAGTSLSAATFSVGPTGGTATKYSAAYDVFQTVSATAVQITNTIGFESQTGTKAIVGTLTLTGCNASALTTGAVDVSVLTSISP